MSMHLAYLCWCMQRDCVYACGVSALIYLVCLCWYLWRSRADACSVVVWMHPSCLCRCIQRACVDACSMIVLIHAAWLCRCMQRDCVGCCSVSALVHATQLACGNRHAVNQLVYRYTMWLWVCWYGCSCFKLCLFLAVPCVSIARYWSICLYGLRSLSLSSTIIWAVLATGMWMQHKHDLCFESNSSHYSSHSAGTVMWLKNEHIPAQTNVTLATHKHRMKHPW